MLQFLPLEVSLITIIGVQINPTFRHDYIDDGTMVVLKMASFIVALPLNAINPKQEIDLEEVQKSYKQQLR